MLERFYTNWKYQGHVYERVEVVDMALAVFHDSQDDFQHINLTSIQPLIEEMFLDREQQLKYLLTGDEKKSEEVIMGVITKPDVFSSSPKREQKIDSQILLIPADDEDDDDNVPLEPFA